MYTLRIIEEERTNVNEPFEVVVKNFELGDAYTKIYKESSSEFSKYVGDEFESVYCVVIARNGHEFYITNNTELRRFTYYIMSDSGNTFEKL